MKHCQTIQIVKPKGLSSWIKLYGLYRSAFPAAERKPFALILSKYRSGVTDIWCLQCGGGFAGLAITINGSDTILLDYFAVADAYRGQGVGSAALPLLRQCYEGKGFFLEIESTLEPSDNPEQRRKRKQFYLSAGMEEMHVTAKLFGVNMELLGFDCKLDYDSYKAFYRDNYGQWAADHIDRP